jgi:hypothetical protein
MLESKPADEAAPEPAAADAPEAPVEDAKIDEEAIMAIVQPKLDEIYKILADIKTSQESTSMEDKKDEMKAEFSSQDSLVELIKYAKRK